MGKQSKTKSTQAAVTKDKDMECSRTTIENRLIEEAKCDDDKTEELHAFVDDMFCLDEFAHSAISYVDSANGISRYLYLQPLEIRHLPRGGRVDPGPSWEEFLDAICGTSRWLWSAQPRALSTRDTVDDTLSGRHNSTLRQ